MFLGSRILRFVLLARKLCYTIQEATVLQVLRFEMGMAAYTRWRHAREVTRKNKNRDLS